MSCHLVRVDLLGAVVVAAFTLLALQRVNAPLLNSLSAAIVLVVTLIFLRHLGRVFLYQLQIIMTKL